MKTASEISTAKEHKQLLIGGIVIFLTFATTCFTQEIRDWQGSGGWGMVTPYGKMFDSRAVETIRGEVLAIEKIIPLKGMSYGVQVVLRTETDTIAVHLGPEWFMENQDLQIERQDIIEVKGSRITFDGQVIMIATEILRRTEILRLRNNIGLPSWIAWRRR
jgi:hypothetical protein